ncbi:MAG: autoinducer binding domain-containing protein [Henriciella sp.]|nr:autoinducer binding domain-containing protein [Henriciella sp.]
MLEEYFEEIISANGIERKFDTVHTLAKGLGFKDVFYARVIKDDENARLNDDNLKRLRRGNEKWIASYERQNFRQIDWAIEKSVSSYSPFRLDDIPKNLTANQIEFVRYARENNRQNGFALPLRNGFGISGGFSATGAEYRPDDVSIAKLIACAQFFDLLVCSEISDTRASEFSLTKREVRLLKLFVNGRSMAQIAHFVGATEQWIRKSFLDMRRKMKANSNSELVYRAVAMKIIN